VALAGQPCYAQTECCPGGGTRWRDHDRCATIPQGAIPAPLGTYVNGFERWQTAKANADDFVIYKHEWLCAGIELGPYGTYHLGQIIRRLPEVPFPVLIEYEAPQAVSEARRKLIVARLSMAGISDAERRVQVGFPEAGGLYGEEAPRIFLQMITNQGQNNQSGQGFGRNIFPGFGSSTLFGGGLGGAFGGGFGGLGGMFGF
jgi:hypothetical protein